MTGTCGTCGHDAEATGENEGYSYCCNDRIEYGLEAEETKERIRRVDLGESQCWHCDGWQPAAVATCCGESLEH